MLLTGLSAITSLVLVYLLSRPDSPLTIPDEPNARSLHSVPVSRTGGLGILAGILLAGGLLIARQGYPVYLVALFVGILLIASISLVDDKRGVSVRYRLAVHALAAVLFIHYGFYVGIVKLPFFSLELPTWLAFLFSFLLILWGINLFNFMDGMDGFAGGMALVGFSSFSLLGMKADAPDFALLAAIVAGANGAFLLFNFPPARIFMGDAGSSVQGFLMAAMMLWADAAGIFPLWIGVLIFAPFIVDATLTLLRRTLRGERIWLAHRSHLYQRLVLSGWGHRRTVLTEYGLMLICVLLAVGAVFFPDPVLQTGIFIASISFCILGYVLVSHHLSRQERHAEFE